VTPQVGYAWSNVLSDVKGGIAASDKYEGFITATLQVDQFARSPS